MEDAGKVTKTNGEAVAPAAPEIEEDAGLIPNPEIIADEEAGPSDGVEVIYDNPPPIIRKAEATKLTNGVDKALVAADSGGDVFKSLTEGMMEEGNTVESGLRSNLEANIKRTAAGLINQVDPTDAGNLIASRVKEATDGSVIAPYKAYIRAMPSSELLNEKQIEEAAYGAFTQHKIAEVWDSMSKGAVVGDFVQMVLLPTDNYKMKALADYFQLPHTTNDLILKGDFVKKFASSLNELPPENRAHIFKKVVDNWEVIGGFDNKMELIAFLSRLEGIDDLDSAMMFFESFTDLLSVAALPKAAMGAVKAARGAAGVVENITQQASLLRRIAATKNPDVLADAAIAGAKGELKAVGVDPLDAANTMLPFENTKVLTQGAPENVSSEILKRQQLFDEIAKEERMLDLPIDEAQRQQIIDKVMSNLEKQDEITNIKLISQDGRGFTFEYDSFMGTEKHTVMFKPSDTGVWEDLTYKHGGLLFSKNYKLPGIASDLVQGPEQALHAGSRIKKQLDTIIRSSLKSLKDHSIEKINGLLSQGEGKKVFSYGEAVGTGVNGIKYTPEEFRAYSTIRQAFDTLKVMKEGETLAKWKMDNVWKFDLHGHLFNGKVYDDANAAMSGFRSSKTYSNWYIHEGKIIQADLTNDVIKDMYSKSYRLVKTDALQMYKSGINAAEWVFKKADDLIDPATRPILNAIPGYVTRINEEANFFLKKKVSIKIGDKNVDQWITEAYYDKYADLEDYRKTLSNADEYEVFRDRQLTSTQYSDDIISTFGGLFTGHRASTPLQYGPPNAGLVGKQAPVLEALQRYIENVARNMPLAIFREGLKQKWINTAIKKNILDGYTGKESFSALESMMNPNHPNYFFFRNSYNEIKFITSIKSLDEMEWASRWFEVGKWFDNSRISFVKDMSSFFYNGRIRDIAGGLKTATYHALLGMGNMAQPFIQFSGAILPVAANPVHGIRGLGTAMELTVLDYMARFGNINAMKTSAVDMDIWKMWNKSGMGDTVYGSVDYSAGKWFSDAPYDAGYIRKLASVSDVGVKIGEAGYARVAFATAYHNVSAKLGRALKETDMSAVLARAEQYRLNMTRANMAEFQRHPILSFAMMFMQVQTKFIEKMFGRDFTLAEKLRMGSAQIALYGAAGAPLIGTLSPAILSFFGQDTRNRDPETLAKMQKGAIGWFVSDYLGTNVEVSDRLSLGNNFLESAMKLVMSPTGTAPLEMLSGASWAVLSRGADALQKSWYVGKVVMNADNVDDKMILGGARVIADEFGQIAASYRNLMKGMVMYNSKMYHNKDGLPVFQYRDPSFTAALAQAIGFQNTEAKNWYEIADGGSVFERPKASDNYAKTMASIMVKLINADVDRQDVYAAAYNAMLSAALTQRGGEDVLDKVIKYLETPGTTWHEQMIKGLKLHQAEYTEGLEELIKQGRVRSNVTLGREAKKYGVDLSDG